RSDAFSNQGTGTHRTQEERTQGMNYNKVIIGGNLTRDPELNFTSGNQAVCNFGIAINRKWKSADGQQREETTFVDCQAWGQTAEFIGKHFSRGSAIFAEGRLKLDQWEDKEGRKQQKLRVTVENVQFAGGGGGNGQNRNQGNAPARRVGGVQADNIDVPF
ncbi:MAG: single-stranded DNA-binding protein, partial [Chloroflexi bacterium]|nr:single-stranded DNA-binding protein [Chloroflexota bacterium]